MGKINVDLAFTANTSAAKAQLDQLKNTLTQLGNMTNIDLKTSKMTQDIMQASNAALQLKAQLQAATNVNTGKLSLAKFNQELKTSGMTLADYRVKLSALGSSGTQAFAQLTQNIMQADAALSTGSKLLGNFAQTLANVAKYQFSTAVYRGVTQAISTAYTYAQDLNASLNKIRIVTGQSVEQMDKFAEKANKAAKALSTTTTAYTDAALIFYQQGLNDKEVEQRTNVVVKMMNVTGQAAEETSSQMTAIWNNFAKGSENLEHYADVITALGAATASSSKEIAEGLQKFAAIADTVGLSYEYATTALATVVAQTRQSADVVGTAFKTLFARIQDLELGKTLDDGTTLGKYAKALDVIGVNVKTASGEVKDMNSILDEMGAKWGGLSDATKIAVAQTVAGTRQYAQLMALMDNWGEFQKNLTVANDSVGTLNEQADIYAQSWEGAKKRVKASVEDIYKTLIDDKFFIGLNNGLAKVLDAISSIIKGMGGLKGIVPLVTSLLLQFAGPQILHGLTAMKTTLVGMLPSFMSLHNAKGEFKLGQTFKNIGDAAKAGYKEGGVAGGIKAVVQPGTKAEAEAENMRKAAFTEMRLMQDSSTTTGQAKISLLQKQENLQQEIANLNDKITKSEKEHLNSLMDRNRELEKTVATTGELAEKNIAEKDKAWQNEKENTSDAYSAVEADKQTYLTQLNKLKDLSQQKNIVASWSKATTGNATTLGLNNDSPFMKAAENALTDEQKIRLQEIKSQVAHRPANHSLDENTQKDLDTIGQAIQAYLQRQIKHQVENVEKAGNNVGLSKDDTDKAIGYAKSDLKEAFNQAGFDEAINQGKNAPGFKTEELTRSERGFIAKAENQDILNKDFETIKTQYLQKQEESIGLDGLNQMMPNMKDISAESITTTEQLDVLKDKLRELKAATDAVGKEAAPELSDALKNIDIDSLDAKGAIEQLDKAGEALKKDTESNTSAINQCTTALRVKAKQEGRDVASLDKAIDATTEATNATKEHNRSIYAAKQGYEDAQKAVDQYKIKTQSLGAISMTALRGVTSLASSLNMLKSVIAIFNDTEKTFGEKMLTALPMLLPIVSMAMTGITSLATAIGGLTTKIAASTIATAAHSVVQKIDNFTKQESVAIDSAQNVESLAQLVKIPLLISGKQAQTIAEKLLTKAKEKGTVVTWQMVAAEIAAQVAAGPIVWIIMAIIAALAGLIAIMTILAKKEEERKKREKEALDQQLEQIKQTKELIKTTEELSTSIEDLATQYDELRNSGQNTYDTFNKLITQAPELIKHYRDLEIQMGKTWDVMSLEAALTEAKATGDWSKFIAEKQRIDAEIKNANVETLESEVNVLGAKVINGIETKGLVLKEPTDTRVTLDEAKAEEKQILAQAWEEYKGGKNGVSFKDNLWIQDLSNTEDYIHYYEALLKGRNALSKNFTAKQLSESDIYKELNEKIAAFETDNNIQDAQVSYQELLSQYRDKITTNLKEANNNNSLTSYFNTNGDDRQAFYEAHKGDLSWDTVQQLYSDSYSSQVQSAAKKLSEVTDEEKKQSLIKLFDNLQTDSEREAFGLVDLAHLNLTAIPGYIEAQTQKIALSKIEREISENEKLDIDTWQIYKDQLSQANNLLKDTSAITGQVAKDNMLFNQGLQTAAKSWKTYSAAINGANKNTTEYAEGIAALQKGFEEAFGFKVSSDWIENNKDLINTLMTAESFSTADQQQWNQALYQNAKNRILDIKGTGENANAKEFALLSIINDLNNKTDTEIFTYLNDPKNQAKFQNSLFTQEELTSVLNAMRINYNSETRSMASSRDLTMLNTELIRKAAGTDKSSLKKHKLAEDEIDAYHEIKRTINATKKELDEYNKIAEKSYGTAKLNALDQQINKNKQLITQYQTQQQIAQTQSNLYAQKINDLGYNVELVNGEIKNYAELYNQALLEYNNAIDQANKGMLSAEALTEIQERYENFKNYISEYEEATDIFKDAVEQQKDIEREIQSKNYEKYTYELEIKTTLNENDKKFIEYFLGKVEDDIYKVAEATKYLTQQQNNLKNALTLQGDAYTKLEQQKDQLSQTDYVEGLQNIYDATIDNLQALNEYDEKMKTYYSDTITKGIEEMDKYIDRMDKQTELLKHYQTLLKLSGQEFDYDKQLILLNGLVDQARLKTEKVTQEVISLEKARVHAAQELAATDNDELRKIWQDELNRIDDELTEKRTAQAEATEEQIEALGEVFKTTLAATFKELENNVTDGLGFNNIITQLQNIKNLADLWLDDTNKTYETNKMLRDIGQAIDKTDNKAAKNRLSAFADEIKQMQNRGQLTKAELELAQSRYKVLQAQIALEEAQNAKSVVRLRRDNEGNFGYVYTADENKIADAEQKVEDEENAYYNKKLNLARDSAIKDTQLQQEWANKRKEIWQQYWDGEIASEEERDRLLKKADEYYNKAIEGNAINLQIALGNADDPQSIYGQMSDGERSYMNTVLKSTEILPEEIEKSEKVAQEAYATTHTEVDALTAALIGSGDSGLQGATDKVKDATQELANALGDQSSGVVKAMNDAFKAAQTLTGEWSTQYNTIQTLKEYYEKQLLPSIQDAIKKQQELNNLTDTPTTSQIDNYQKIKFYGQQTDVNGTLWYSNDGNLWYAKDNIKESAVSIDDEYEYSVKQGSGVASDKINWPTKNKKIQDNSSSEEINSPEEQLQAFVNKYKLKESDRANWYLSFNAAGLGSLWQTAVLSGTSKEIKGFPDEEFKDSEGSGDKPDPALNYQKQLAEKIKNLYTKYQGFDGQSYPATRYENGKRITGFDKGKITKDQLIQGFARATVGDTAYQIKLYDTNDKESNYYLINASKIGNNFYQDYLKLYNSLDLNALQYDTGGYTGQWGPNGKLAVLHQKEIVLNADDTKNFLQAIDILRSIVSVIDLGAMQAMSNSMVASSVNTSSNSLNQNVTIHAEFPNAVNHSEIEQAFDNLVNKASQYANRY